MSEALKAAQRADEARLEAVARVDRDLALLAKPRRPAPRVADVDQWFLPDGTEVYVQSDGVRVDLTLGHEDGDSITAAMDDVQTVQLAEALLRGLGTGVNPGVSRDIVQARIKLRGYLDDLNQHGYGDSW